MKTGKRSLMSTFVALILGMSILGLGVSEVQARPHRGYHHTGHYARHFGSRSYAAAQPQCNYLFDPSECNTQSYDPWNGYQQATAATTRRGSRRAAQVAYADNDSWGSSHSGVIGTAQSMMGLSERGNRGALRRTLGVDPARTPWCAAWANAVLRRNGYRGTGSNMARSFYRYGAPSQGNIGDIAVMPHHVGFVAGYQVRNGRRYVGVLGGNTSNRVKTAWYPAGRVSFRDPS